MLPKPAQKAWKKSWGPLIVPKETQMTTTKIRARQISSDVSGIFSTTTTLI